MWGWHGTCRRGRMHRRWWWQTRGWSQGRWWSPHRRGPTHRGWLLWRVLLLVWRRAHAKAWWGHHGRSWGWHASKRLTTILKAWWRRWPTHAWWWSHTHWWWWTHVRWRWEARVKRWPVTRGRRPPHHGPHHWGWTPTAHHAWRRRAPKSWWWAPRTKTWRTSWRKTIGTSVAMHKTALHTVVWAVTIGHFKTVVAHQQILYTTSTKNR